MGSYRVAAAADLISITRSSPAVGSNAPQPFTEASGNVHNDPFRDLFVGRAIGGAPFTLGDTFGAINDPHAHVIDDFNGDGKLDIAVPGGTSNKVVVGLGDGAGGFTFDPVDPLEFFTYPGTEPRSLATGDLNGDGIRDPQILLDEFADHG